MMVSYRVRRGDFETYILYFYMNVGTITRLHRSTHSQFLGGHGLNCPSVLDGYLDSRVTTALLNKSSGSQVYNQTQMYA